VRALVVGGDLERAAVRVEVFSKIRQISFCGALDLVPASSAP
jgi:hypothetical protein